jgi:CHASE2 domain-containing sensor protein
MAISGPDTAGLADSLPVPAINLAAGVLETTLKRRLFPIRCAAAAHCLLRLCLSAVILEHLLTAHQALTSSCYTAVWALQRSASQQGHRHLLCTMYHQVWCCC